MKTKVLYLSFFLLLTGMQVAYSQYPRRANIAIIESDSSYGRALLRKCGTILKREGYDVCRFNPESMMLTTNSYFINHSPILVYYQLNIYGNFILLRGYVMDLNAVLSGTSGKNNDPWERSSYRSISGTTWRIGFRDMVMLTESIRSASSGKVRWSIEESRS